MTNFDTIDKLNTSFVTLSDQELMETDGGAFLTATIAGVAVWKIGVAVIGGAAVLFGGGAALGYYANRP